MVQLRARPAPTSLADADWRDGWALLAAAGIPAARHAIVEGIDGMASALAGMRYPVAVKLDGESLAHKTEIGGLRLGLMNAAEAVAAARELLEIGVTHLGTQARLALLVQEMAAGRRELILGLVDEPGLGLAVMLGVGGVFAEVLDDVTIRAAPLTRFDAEEMMRDLRAHAVLGEIRGMSAIDPTALVTMLLGLSDLAMRARGRILELDINPVIVSDDGRRLTAVDVLVRTG